MGFKNIIKNSFLALLVLTLTASIYSVAYASNTDTSTEVEESFHNGYNDEIGQAHAINVTAVPVEEKTMVGLDWKNMTDAELDKHIEYCDVKDVGEFLLGLSDDDFYEIIERDTILKQPVYIYTDTGETKVDDEGNIIPVMEKEILFDYYWEKAASSCMSLFSWDDRGYYDGTASGYFHVEIEKDGSTIERFKVEIKNIKSGNYTLGSGQYEISGLDGNFNISSVTTEEEHGTWAGIVVKGSYTHPAHYVPSWDGTWPGLGRNDPWNASYTSWSLDTGHVSSNKTDNVRIQVNSGNWGGLTGYSSCHSVGIIVLEKFNDQLKIDANGGTYSGTNPSSKKCGNTTVLSEPTRVGYRFTGWTLTNGSGSSGTLSGSTYTHCNSGTTWDTSDDVYVNKTSTSTVKASWSACSYNIAFNANGGSGTMSNMTGVKYGESKTLKANAFTKTGYTFQGWATSPTGSKKYADKASVKNLTETNGATVTLYAVWKINSYTLTVKPNGGTWGGKTADSTVTQNYKTSYTVADATRTGYRFNGWTKAGTGTFDDATNKWTYEAGNGSLTAKWLVNKYTVVYNKNKPSNASNNVAGTTASSSHTYDTAANLTANGYSLVGHTFTGWNTKTDGSGTAYADKASVKNLTSTHEAKFNLYAQWRAHKYTVVYNKNTPATASSSITGTMANSSYTYDVASTLRTNTYKLTGWIFQGWNTKADGSGTAYADGAAVSNWTTVDGGSITLYAQWKPITYTLTYNGNSSRYTKAEITGSGSSAILTYDVNSVLEKYSGAPNNFECNTEHYRFDHWDTKSDDTGTDYKEGQTVVNLTTTNNATVTMYAQYKVQYRVHHYLQDNDGTYPTTPDYTDINFDLIGKTVGSSYIKTINGYFAPYANSTNTPTNGIASKNITINIDYEKNEIHYFYPKKDFNVYVDPNTGTWRGTTNVTTVNVLVGGKETIELPENPYSGTLRFYYDSSLDGADTLVGERPVNKIFDGWTHTGGGEFTGSKTGNSRLDYLQDNTTKQAVHSGDAYLTANYVIGYYQLKQSDVPAPREHYKFLGWNIDPTVYPNPDIYNGDDAIYDPVVDAKYQANNSAKVTDYVVGDKIYILEDPSTGKTYIYESDVNTWVEANLYEVWRVDFELDTVLTRVLKPDGSDDPGFRAGEAGELYIDTVGFADEINIEFPTVLHSLDKTLSEHRDITPLLTDSNEKQFNVPLYAPSGAYKIKITVYSKSYQDPLVSEHIIYVRKDGDDPGPGWWDDPWTDSIASDFKTKLR